MKILKIDNNRALFCEDFSKGTYKTVKEIGKDDILRFLDYIYNNDDYEIDEWTESCSISNPAEDLIYKNLSEQFIKFANDKETIKSKIDGELIKAEAEYM